MLVGDLSSRRSPGLLQQRNELLVRHLVRYHNDQSPNNGSAHDLWLFHQGDVSARHAAKLQRHARRTYAALAASPKAKTDAAALHFESIAALWAEGEAMHARLCHRRTDGRANNATAPTSAAAEAAAPGAPCSARHGVGFKLMCRFYAVQLMPWLQRHGYAFVLRLDDDGLLASPVQADLFGAMARGGYVYGFRAVRRGKHGDVEASLAAFALQFTLDHQVLAWLFEIRLINEVA